LSTNRQFLVCRSDVGGPFNFTFLLNSSVSTNGVPASSYYYLPSFYHSDPGANGSEWAIRHRCEVTHPAQKAMVVCCAIPPNAAAAVMTGMNNGSGNFWTDGHGPKTFTVQFVDGHARIQKWALWLKDPALANNGISGYDDWSSLSWMDFQ
jgi:hypothetical protein